jgi:UDP-N-acetyl-D-mannosaminuronic acid dehydrogenase
LIRTAREVNDHKPHYVIEQVKEAADQFKKPVIACLGLAFKADIDDLRESPAMDIVQQLAADQVGEVLAVEPHIRDLPASLAQNNVKLVSFEQAIEKANIVLVLVDHKKFKEIDKLVFSRKITIDTRGLL